MHGKYLNYSFQILLRTFEPDSCTSQRQSRVDRSSEGSTGRHKGNHPQEPTLSRRQKSLQQSRSRFQHQGCHTKRQKEVSFLNLSNFIVFTIFCSFNVDYRVLKQFLIFPLVDLCDLLNEQH